MLIARAPVRISLAGGGTDLPAYYEQYGGMVVSTTIDKYFHAFVTLTETDGVEISSSDYRVFYRHRGGQPPLWDGDLGLVKAALHQFDCERGISLFLASQVPPGTGLGSSSSVAVALVKALGTLKGLSLHAAQVAERACRLELDMLRSPIGKQDQFAAAFGGLNAITFSRDSIRVEAIALSRQILSQLQKNLLLFFTGGARMANSILKHQQDATSTGQHDAVAALHAIKEAAMETKHCLETGNLRRFGEVLGETWEQKKQLAPGVTNARIDELYDLARKNGALGGKLAGAGGGGFLMLYCEESSQAAMTQALEDAGLYRMDYQFERGGAQVLMNALPRNISRWPGSERERQLQYA